MIAWLRGTLIARAEDSVVLDVQGVGYRVHMPPTHIRAMPEGEELELHIHTHVREDTLQLFGFAAELERQVFLSLKQVKGIGPKLAMAVLGHSSIPDLVGAVSSGDVKRLTHIPGLGKKTAERILVELREPFGQLVPPPEPGATAPSGDRSVLLRDVASALGNLGFKAGQIDRALDQLRQQKDAPSDFEGLFREALKLVR